MAQQMYAKKEPFQNVYDFVLTWFGNLSYLQRFIELNELKSTKEFGLALIGTRFKVDRIYNQVTKAYYKPPPRKSYYVATGGDPPTGDFNNDFNDDFYI